jgi:hypothetical protein
MYRAMGIENQEGVCSWEVGELKMIQSGNQLTIQNSKGRHGGQKSRFQG